MPTKEDWDHGETGKAHLHAALSGGATRSRVKNMEPPLGFMPLSVHKIKVFFLLLPLSTSSASVALYCGTLQEVFFSPVWFLLLQFVLLCTDIKQNKKSTTQRMHLWMPSKVVFFALFCFLPLLFSKKHLQPVNFNTRTEGSRGLTHGCVVGVGEALVHPLPHELPFVVRKVALNDLVVVLPQLFGGLRGGEDTEKQHVTKWLRFVCLTRTTVRPTVTVDLLL